MHKLPDRFLQTEDDRDEAYRLQSEYAKRLVLLGLTPQYRVAVIPIKTKTGKTFMLVVREG